RRPLPARPCMTFSIFSSYAPVLIVPRRRSRTVLSLLFFFNHTATTEIYTLSYTTLFRSQAALAHEIGRFLANRYRTSVNADLARSEEHTSELQSLTNLVCRLLLEKKNGAPDAPGAPALRRGPTTSACLLRARPPVGHRGR